MPSIYIINARSCAPGYHTSESLCDSAGRSGVHIADLAIVTVAALVPADWDIRLTDEGISPIDFDAEVDFVAVTGKVSQRARMYEIAREFRRRGRIVLIGGPFASLNPDDARPHADILVTGEIEELAPRLFADLALGAWQDRYRGGQVDLRNSPIPRWDLYPVERAQCGAIQTTRGCPFSCEFCDVIQYQGRKHRHKEIERVIAEIEALYEHGFRRVLIVDDNFTVYRQWARTVLDALIAFNAARPRDPMSFITQASLDIARDEELLDKCRAAGLRTLFVGIETVNQDSLRETGKRQNLLMPIRDSVMRIVGRGIGIQAGIIAGFDHDGPGIFDQLFEFFQASPLPDLLIGTLNAPNATPLYARMKAEGRLAGEYWDGSGYSLWTNIIPARMTRDQLMDGAAELSRRAYRAENYERRMLNLIESYPAGEEAPKRQAGIRYERTEFFLNSLRKIAARGPAEAAMIAKVLGAADRKPGVMPLVIHHLSRYEQARYYLDFHPAEQVAAAG